MHTYVYTYIHTYVYIYIYVDRAWREIGRYMSDILY